MSEPTGEPSQSTTAKASDSLILRTITRVLSALMVVFSLFMLLRGHNQPGGGFIGALIFCTAFALYAIAFGPTEVRRALRIDPRYLIPIGLAAGLGAGLMAFFAGEPLLTGLWLKLHFGEATLKLSSVLLFDIGVYLVVIGAVLTLLLCIEEEA